MQSSSRTPRRQQWLDKFFAVLVCASLLLSSIAAAPAPLQSQTDTPPAAPTATTEPQPEQTAPAVAASAQDPTRVNFHQIVVKFKEGTEVSVQDQKMVGASADLASVVQALDGLDVRPLFSTALQVQDQLKASAAGADALMPALDRYYYVELKPEATFEEAQTVLQSLQANGSVEIAYMEPVYTPASRSMIVDNLEPQQGYLNPDPGMNVKAAWATTGARGLNVQIVDIEDGWQIGHEDLALKSGDLIESSNSSDPTWVNHGAAVVGVIAGKNNGFGITGVASDTYVRMVSRLSNLTPDAIVKAAANSRPGDIILIPVQAIGPVSGTTCPVGCDCTRFESIPIEYWQANFDAIYTATQLGIIVVEAAGNGAMNLDDTTLYKNLFNRSSRDSGAILVGAGQAVATHAPVCDANYGKRIDMQGWGENVVTAGYGDAPESGADPNEYYTDVFGGSSAASAMVAGAASSLQGVARNNGYLLTPSQMRSILRSTGVAQTADLTRPIGPLPNVKNAIDTKLTSGVVLLSPADNAVDVFTLKPTLDWQDYINATQYELQVSDKSTFSSTVIDITTTATEYTSTVNLVSGRLYFWRVRPFVTDVWQDWSPNVFRFTPISSSAPAITLLKPINNYVSSNADGFRPEFTWKEPTAAPDGYQIQISSNYDFSGAADVFTPQPYTPAAPLTANARYYWRVRSYIGVPPANASFGPWTSRRIFFTAPDISNIGPLQIIADGQEDTLRPTFDWNDIANARAYQVQVSTVNTFKSAVMNAVVPLPTGETVVPSQFTPGSDLPRAKSLFWHVRVKGSYAWSSWSNFATLDTLNPPAAPSLILPANGAVVNTWESGVLFTWKKPSNNPDSYHIQIASDKLFENIVEEDDTILNPDPADLIKVPNYTALNLVAESVYYWRVRAVGDGTSNWSTVRIIKTTPSAPVNLSVEDPALSLRPTFDWDRTDFARSYNLVVAKDNPAEADKTKLFTSSRIVANVVTFTSPPFVITSTLPRSTDLVWRVRAGGLYGYSAWSEVSGPFTTPYPPNAPVIASPANGANIANFTPTLDWYDSVKISGKPETNAVSYELQISNRTDFTAPDPLVDIAETFDGLTISRFPVPVDLLTVSGTYYWRVRAVNADGQFSIWSSITSFITPGIITGTISDALTGDPLPSVTVQLDNLGVQTTTDSNGEYRFRGIPSGSYVINVASSEYMRQRVTVGVSAGANRIRNIDLAKIPDTGSIRIVLTWNGTPADMDAHLWLPASDKYHVYYDAAHLGDQAAFPFAEMERSDNDGYGPEIITLSQTAGNGTYKFAVFTHGTAEQLQFTGAHVQVYDGATRLIDISVPGDGVGHWWNVFTIDSTTRKVKLNSYITDNNPAPYKD